MKIYEIKKIIEKIKENWFISLVLYESSNKIGQFNSKIPKKLDSRNYSLDPYAIYIFCPLLA